MIKAIEEGPITPDVSTENETKWQPDDSDVYFLRFMSSAAFVADTERADEAVMSEEVKVSE